jgi:hypothetical protein
MGFLETREIDRAPCAIAILPMLEQGALYEKHDSILGTTANVNREFQETVVTQCRFWDDTQYRGDAPECGVAIYGHSRQDFADGRGRAAPIFVDAISKKQCLQYWFHRDLRA